jgi:hypothetical protein
MLKLYVADELECSGQYIFSFTLRNPNCAQTCQAVTIEQLSLCNGVVIPASTMDWEGSCKSCPLQVIEPRIKTFHVTQSTAAPACNNTITVSLRANVDIFVGKGCDTTLTIAGLTGLCKPANGLIHISEGCGLTNEQYMPDSLQWRSTAGSLEILFGKDVPKELDICFTFPVTNPANPVAAKGLTLTAGATGLFSCLARQSATSSDFDMYKPGTVFAAEFDIFQIGQSSPWLCASNRITVVLKSNQPLSGDTLVTLSGMTGFTTTDSRIPVTDEHSDSNAVSMHRWKNGRLEVSLTNFNTSCVVAPCKTPGAYRFSFVLTNDQTCSPAQVVTIDASMKDACGATQLLIQPPGKAMQNLPEPVQIQKDVCESKYSEVRRQGGRERGGGKWAGEERE